MKRSDLRSDVDYAHQARSGPAYRVRIVDTATLYERYHSDPAQTFRPSTATSAQRSGVRAVGMLAEYCGGKLTGRLLVNPRHIVGTWEEHQVAEAAAQEKYRAERAERQALYEVTRQQTERIAKLLTVHGLSDSMRVAPNVDVQRVPNDVLLALLLRAAR